MRSGLTGRRVRASRETEAVPRAAIGGVDRLAGRREAPALVGPLRQGHRCARAEGPFAAAAAANRQPLFPVDPKQLLVVHLDAFPA